jgi:Phosphotransferase enzyme family
MALRRLAGLERPRPGTKTHVIIAGTRTSPELVAGVIAPAGSSERIASIHFERSVIRRDHRLDCYCATFVHELTGAVRQGRILAKFHGPGRARAAHDTAMTLWEAGFRPPSRLQVARPLGYSRRLGASFQELIPEVTWLDHLAGDEATITRVSARAAEWVAALHHVSSGTCTEARADSSLEAAAMCLTIDYPRVALRLVELARLLDRELAATEDPLVASHGDYHPKNLLSNGSTVFVIDLDKAAPRETSFDAGEAIAQLLVMSYYETGATVQGATAALAFWRRYAQLVSVSPERTGMHIGRALIRSLAYKQILGSQSETRVPALEQWLLLAVGSVDDLDPESIIEKSMSLST